MSAPVNYNDGLWHGWNGGECPVHPKTQVVAVCASTLPTGFNKASFHTAGDLDWGADPDLSPIVAFRVIKEHREPREWWVNPELEAVARYKADDRIDWADEGYIRVREVLE